MRRLGLANRLRSILTPLIAQSAGLLGMIVIVISGGQPALGAEFLGLGDGSGVGALSSDGTTVVGGDNGPFGFSWPTRWTFENGTPKAFLLPTSGTHGSADGVSGDGEWIVGLYGNPLAAFLFSEGTGVEVLPGQVIPIGISADGLVIAGNAVSGGRLFRWIQDDQDQFQLELLGAAPFMFATDISNDGSAIVGYSGSAGCNPTCESFRWTEATGLVGLGGLAGSGVPNSRAWGVSGDGAVVLGADRAQGGRWQATQWTLQDGMQSLGMIEGVDHTSARAASADGSVIVGHTGNPFSAGGAFIWNLGDGMQRLEDVLVADFGLADQLAGWTIIGVTDISDDGLTIVGPGINPNGVREAWIAFLGGNVTGDFNNDGNWDDQDINALSGAIKSGSTDLSFDMNGDGLITLADITDDPVGWLAVGGANNSPVTGGNPFLNADSNLDGTVDGLDFVAWNNNKFTDNPNWTDGNWNADNPVDGQDFVIWNTNKFMSSNGVSAVPEPTTVLLFWMVLAGLLLKRTI